MSPVLTGEFLSSVWPGKSAFSTVLYKWSHVVCIPFWAWLFLLSMIEIHPCCYMYEWFIPFSCWIVFPCFGYTSLFIHSPVDGHLSCFHPLAIVNNAARVWVYKYLLETPLSILGGSIPTSGTAELKGNSVFNFGSNCHTVFQRVCTILQSQQQCRKIPISLYPHQHLLFSGFSFCQFDFFGSNNPKQLSFVHNNDYHWLCASNIV